MNEQRTQAYLNLINQILTCNQGDEPQILQENQELLDRGLIETMVSVAKQDEETGRKNEAQWLVTIAQQLAKALGLLRDEASGLATETPDSSSLSEDEVNQYYQFLLQTLKLVANNPTPNNVILRNINNN